METAKDETRLRRPEKDERNHIQVLTRWHSGTESP
jgi:hypothetical protein